MARKRSLPAALMALPQALKEALLRTIPEETIAALNPQEAVEIGVMLENVSRQIAALLSAPTNPNKEASDGR